MSIPCYRVRPPRTGSVSGVGGITIEGCGPLGRRDASKKCVAFVLKG